jgi:hypothetical protein
VVVLKAPEFDKSQQHGSFLRVFLFLKKERERRGRVGRLGKHAGKIGISFEQKKINTFGLYHDVSQISGP